MVVTESWISDIAKVVHHPPDQVRELNFFIDGNRSIFNQLLVQPTLHRVFNDVRQSSNYFERVKSVAEFNSKNKYRKRGIALTPTKFGLGFEKKFLYQGGALVHVYTDGTVLVTHGGVEMGQGVHTKMCQIAARSLGVPISLVHISETATNLVPNASPSAGSITTDINGMAVLHACEQVSLVENVTQQLTVDQINKRLQPYRVAAPDKEFKDWVASAYFDCVSLSANGYYQARSRLFYKRC